MLFFFYILPILATTSIHPKTLSKALQRIFDQFKSNRILGESSNPSRAIVQQSSFVQRLSQASSDQAKRRALKKLQSLNFEDATELAQTIPFSGDTPDQVHLQRYLTVLQSFNAKLESNLLLFISKRGDDVQAFEALLKNPSVKPSALFAFAAECGFTHTVERLLTESSILFNDRDSYALRHACAKGHSEVVKLLLDSKKMDVTARNQESLVTAIQHRHIDIIKLLLKNMDVDPLRGLAVASTRDTIIVPLLREEVNFRKKLARIFVHSEFKDRDFAAVAQGFKQMRNQIYQDIETINAERDPTVNVYIGNIYKRVGDDPNLASKILKNPSLDHFSFFTLAISHNFLEGFKLMMSASDRIDPSSHANVAIVMASERGFESIVQLLLAHSKVNPSDQNNAALLAAVRQGHERIVERLLSDPRVNPAYPNHQPLRLAIEGNYSPIVLALSKDPRVDLKSAMLKTQIPQMILMLKAALERRQVSQLRLESIDSTMPSSYQEEQILEDMRWVDRNDMISFFVGPKLSAVLERFGDDDEALEEMMKNPTFKINDFLHAAAKLGYSAMVSKALADPKADPQWGLPIVRSPNIRKTLIEFARKSAR